MTGWSWLIGASVCAVGALLFLVLVADAVAYTENQLHSLERHEAWARQRRMDSAAKAKARRKKVA